MAEYFMSDTHDRIHLGVKIGGGGEGNVFALQGSPQLVVKIYHQPDRERQQKVQTLVSLRSPVIESYCAWPLAPLVDDRGTVIGFLMRRADGQAKAVHDLFGPASRRNIFPRADWRFLIRTAENIARAFANCHDRDIVIGDINENSVLVSTNSTVTLIDCDSFQVMSNSQIFRCRVGVPTYTPPELHGENLAKVDRTPNNDRFGLAVLIFQLLFMGRHPFVGKYLGKGQMPLEQAIQEHRFAFGAQHRGFLMEPPPWSLLLKDVGMEMAMLFERAFGPDAAVVGRPEAKEWVGALGRLEQSLVQCRQNAAHHHIAARPCPWCGIETSVPGLVLFPVVVTAAIMFSLTARRFDLAAAWREIEAVPSPGPLPDIIAGLRAPRFPSRTAVLLLARRIVPLLLAAPLASVLLVDGPAWAAVAVVVVAVIVAMNLGAMREPLKERHRQTRDSWSILRARWEQGDEKPFMKRRRQLDRARNDYERLPAICQQRIDELEHTKRQTQLRKFLEAYPIEDLQAPGIGAARKATLRSWGIATAYDATAARVSAVPGFGGTGVLAGNVVDWRLRLERRFKFNPAEATDAAALAALNAEMNRLAGAHEAELAAGAAQLRQIARRTEEYRAGLAPEVAKAWLDYAQVERDRRYLFAGTIR